ncbi:40S ribosomal protein S7-2, partial [Linum grandiflorum]
VLSLSVLQAFFDLENTNQELKTELKNLFINFATQIDVSSSRKAVVIHVPFRLRKSFRKVHEKKFSGKVIEWSMPFVLSAMSV